VIVGGQHDRVFCSNRCVGLSQKQENPKYKSREYKLEKTKAYQARHPDRVKLTKLSYKKKYPWRHVFRGMLARCENPTSKAWPRYGGRGIQIKMTAEDVRTIWIRDKAHLLKQPNIDRIDNDGHYEIGNVQFIEKSENSKKTAIDRKKARAK
jgi:hypothetical protein